VCGEVCWTHTSPHRTPCTHTKRYAAASPQLNFYIFFKFLNSVTLTRNLWAPWRWSEWWSKHVGAFL